MRRRDLIGLAGIGALNFARPAHAQTKANLPVVGLLLPGREDVVKDRLAGVRIGLQQAGFIEGKNYSIIVRFANGDVTRMAALAKELGKFKPAVVVVGTFAATTHKVIPDISVVFTSFAADPVAMGIVESWSHPGGTITGNVMTRSGARRPWPKSVLGCSSNLYRV